MRHQHKVLAATALFLLTSTGYWTWRVSQHRGSGRRADVPSNVALASSDRGVVTSKSYPQQTPVVPPRPVYANTPDFSDCEKHEQSSERVRRGVVLTTKEHRVRLTQLQNCFAAIDSIPEDQRTFEQNQAHGLIKATLPHLENLQENMEKWDKAAEQYRTQN